MRAAPDTDWFLTAEERDNPATEIDRRCGDGLAFTTGNDVQVHVDGRSYFRQLHEALVRLGPGDRVWFTDWRGDGDERLDGPGTEVGAVLARLVRRGVDVRGLVWRSHVDGLHFSERENRHLATMVNSAGGEVLLDERVRRAGCHHQKLVVVRSARGIDDVAFVGGIDLGHGRGDDNDHQGDDQTIDLDPRYGDRPRWHDAQLEIHGPAVAALEHTFRERWNDPLRLDHRVPWRARLAKAAREPRQGRPLPDPFPDPQPVGHHAVQVLRTYPAKRPPFPFAPDGERSVARAYLKVLERAERMVYIEDQYLWSVEIAAAMAHALRRASRLRVVAVVPRYPDHDDARSGPPQQHAQQRFIDTLRAAGGSRVAIYDLDHDGWPVYVHAKVCVVDDRWCAIGSDNLNRRSWTNDSELACAVVDEEIEAAGGFARAVRLTLAAEHLERALLDVEELADPDAAFVEYARAASALEEWHTNGRCGDRPAGRLRPHPAVRFGLVRRARAELLYRTVIDPDGRPRARRRHKEF